MAKLGDGPGAGPANPDENLPLSVLSGVNAQYLDAKYAQYLNDPASVGADWRRFFDAYRDEGDASIEGPSWERRDWPPTPNGEMTAVFDGNWGEAQKTIEKKITDRGSAPFT